jgi:hypothetical protein
MVVSMMALSQPSCEVIVAAAVYVLGNSQRFASRLAKGRIITLG